MRSTEEFDAASCIAVIIWNVFPGKQSIAYIPIVYIHEEDSLAITRGYGFIGPLNRHILCTVKDGVKILEAIELDLFEGRVEIFPFYDENN